MRTRPRPEPPYDFFKYGFRITTYFQHRYKLTKQEFEMLLFLYSEQQFTKQKYDEFENVVAWNKNRFDKLKREGWVDTIINSKLIHFFEISFKGKKMITDYYDAIMGDKIPFSVNSTVNPMMRADLGYAKKVNRNFIVKINAERRANLPEHLWNKDNKRPNIIKGRKMTPTERVHYGHPPYPKKQPIVRKKRGTKEYKEAMGKLASAALLKAQEANKKKHAFWREKVLANIEKAEKSKESIDLS
jgi:hypothetical protein